MQFLVLLGELLGLLREFFRLLRELLVEPRQFLQLLFLRDTGRLGPAGPVEAFCQNAQKQTGGGEDPQGQDVVRGLDAKRPIRRDEPVICRQRREHRGHDSRPATANGRNQEDCRIKHDKGGQRAEVFFQPRLQHHCRSHRGHCESVLKGETAPLFPGSCGRRNGAAEAHGPHEDHGGNTQHQQGDRHPEGNCPDGAVGAGVGRGIPLSEQLLLVRFHCGDHAPQFIHDLLVPVGEDNRRGSRKARLLAELDRLPQYGQLGVGEFLDLLQALLLVRVIAGELDQRVDVVLDLTGGSMERLQIRLLAGEEKSALAGVGICEQQQNVLQALDDLVRVRHPAVRFQQPLCAHVGANADRQDDH